MTFKFKRFPSAKYGKEETAMLKNLFVLEAHATQHGGGTTRTQRAETRARNAMPRNTLSDRQLAAIARRTV